MGKTQTGKKGMTFGEILDEVEKLVIATLRPTMIVLKKQMNLDEEPDEISRNLIMKLGLRMAYGKDLADPIFEEMKKSNKN